MRIGSLWDSVIDTEGVSILSAECEVGKWVEEVGGPSKIAYKLSQIIGAPVYGSMIHDWKNKNKIPPTWRCIIRQNFGLHTIPQCLQPTFE